MMLLCAFENSLFYTFDVNIYSVDTLDIFYGIILG